MAFADKKGIVVASPFKLQAESMLDVRQQVDTLTERNELVTIKAATAGLRVYVKETKKSYVYNGTTWDELSIGNASLVVTLNGGTSEGTNKFTYNGTAAKTVNITADGIGAASKTHNHTKSQITDFPTSMKNPQALKFTGGATATYDGSRAVTVNIPTTAITSKSLVVTLNGGTTEGTNKFTFNGSTEKNINITPSTIGAAAATHTHNVNQITGLTTGRALVSDANGHPSVSSTTATELSYLHGVTSSVQTQLNNKAALNHTHNYAGSSSAGGAANSAVKLQTARKLNGVSFDGSADINIPNNYFASMDEEDLNQKVTFGEYYGAGGNSCKNLPSGVDWFYLRIFKTASGYVGQNLYANGTWYSRYKNGTSWTSWSEQYSSTNKPTPSEIGAAASSHTHTASQITGLPTSLKNPYAITFTGAATGTYDGSRAVTINIPTTGASTKASLVIQLNGGNTEGTNKFTFNGSAAKTINITPGSIGAAAASHGTHVTYGTSAPKANGTASAGSANSVSRSDHVHPLQTTVSGNAGSATKLQTKRNIDGVQFDGSASITHFGSCSTAAGTAAKVVSCTGFVLGTGARITVKFTVTNTAASPTLNVNGTGAKAIKYRGSTISAGYLAANRVYTFIYDGTDYELVGDINTDTNTTYNTGTASTAGLTKLYTTTGSAVDGTMTQKAITDALRGKAASSHTHNYAGSSSAGGAANSANRLNGISLTGGGGSGATTGYRLIATVKINAWSNYRGVFAVNSRHTGAGLLCISVGCNNSSVSFANGYSEIMYFGPVSSGSIISSDSFLVHMSSDGTKAYIFWKFIDYNTTTIVTLDSDFAISNGTWMTSISTSTYGNRKATTTINPSSAHNHSASNITSGTLSVARGGTGLTASPSLLVNLASTSAASVLTASPRPGITGTLPVSHGGTGATTALAANYNILNSAIETTSGFSDSTMLAYFSRSPSTSAGAVRKYKAGNVWSQWLNGKISASYAAKSHTHNYAGSSSAGGAANSVKTSLIVRLNGGTTEGTNQFTFNGSAAKTINITPGSIGAATSSHTHKYAGSSSAGGAANSANRVPVPVGTVLFATSSSTTFFNSCFGGTWEIVGNIDAIVGNGTTLTLYMFRKTKA